MPGHCSSVNVAFDPNVWKYANWSVERAVLIDVQLVELLEYISMDELAEEDGYVSSNVVASDQTKTDSSASSDLEFD